jgi:two-component system chemotaxis response regulator CheY
MKILIVDDSRFFRVQLKDILNELGYNEISEAEDGRLALRKLNREHFGLVFLDWEMPNVNGIQVLNVIRTTQFVSDIPVIMVTSQAKKHHILEAIKAGVNSYIVKPIDRGTVEKKLIEVGLKKQD